MSRLAIIAILISMVLCAQAQVNFKATLSPKHQQKVAQTSDAREKLKRYKKFLEKDKKKQLKKYRDSLENIALERVPLDSSMIISHLPDSSSMEDSLEWALNTLSRFKHYEDIEAYYKKISGLDSAMIPKLDSLNLEPRVQQIAARYIPEDLDIKPTDFGDFKSVHMEGIPSDLPIDLTKNPMDQVAAPDLSNELPEIPNEILEEADAEEKVQQLAKRVKGKQMARAQAKLEKIKEKYISVPDLNKPEEGIKRNSLEGRPLIDRLHLGGNFLIQSTDPLVLDTDIQLGYKINKDLTVGAGFRWRESFVKGDSLAGTMQDAHGYSGFVSHDIAKGFFVYGEYLAVKDQPIFNEVSVTGEWQYEYLLGIGRRFDIFKFLDMNIMILYDFNHKNNNIHPRPFEVRIGYQVTKLSRLNPFNNSK